MLRHINRQQLHRWSHLLVAFLIGQGASQILRIVLGFALIRWLTKEDYATFSLVLAIQGTAAVLVELGFSGGLIALIGNRFQQPAVVGRYVKAVMFYRNKLLLAGAVILIGVFYSASLRYDWSLGLSCILWVAVVGSLTFEARSSFYIPILELHQRVREMYSVDVIGSICRLILLLIAYAFDLLTAPAALLIGCFQSFMASSAAKHWGKRYIQLPSREADLSVEKNEALKLSLPKVVGAVFFAFQGQVTIFLIGIFGQYNQMADMGALGKIGMIFMIPSAFRGMLLVPWFAKLPAEKLLRAYLLILAVYISFGVALMTATWCFPQLFLFILGTDYSSLNQEIFLFSISATFTLLTGLSYYLTACRKWVYYWSGPTAIAVYVTLIIYFVSFVDLSLISNVILLSILNAVSTFVINQIVFIIGYRREKQAQI